MKAGAVLYLLVGLPGSGKTVRAREIERSEHALRITPDEWMIPLFGGGESRAPSRRDVLEGLLIALALRALQAGISVILDFGLWARDERSALAWLAESVGARASVVYMEADEQTQLERGSSRYRTAPHVEYRMSQEELAGWRTVFQVPAEDELAGTLPARPPTGFEDWSAWATARWPALPPLSEMRIGQA